MAKHPPLEDQLAELSKLRREPDPAVARLGLTKSLKQRSPYLVAKAARLTAELGHDELVDSLTAAFDRFMADPVRTDKGCVAKVAIARALVELEVRADDTYLLGVRHRQLEAAYGPPVDTAVPLRAASAEGLLVSRHPDLGLEMTELLVDTEVHARLVAARVLGASGRPEAEPLLRLKAHLGDTEPEVTTEVLTGLLALAPQRSLPFVARFLDKDDPAIVETAALALGESRLEGAVELLDARYQRCAEFRLRQTLLICLSMLRREAALDILLDRLQTGSKEQATHVLVALAIHRDDEVLREGVQNALANRSDGTVLQRIFAEEFG